MKKTLNNKKYLAVLLSAVMLLGACSNEVTDFSLKEAVTETTNDTGNVSYEESTKAIKQDVTGSFPAFYNTQIGKCTFSIDKIDSPEEITLYSGTASKTNADYLGLAKELLKGETYTFIEETVLTKTIQNINIRPIQMERFISLTIQYHIFNQSDWIMRTPISI